MVQASDMQDRSAAPIGTKAKSRDTNAPNLLEAVRSALAAELESDPKVLVYGQDVGVLGGIFRATSGLRDQFGSERVVDTPLSEGAIVGSAVGLAAAGYRPVIEIQFLGFALQAAHQILGQASRMRARSRGKLPMPITIRTPYGGGVRTPELHADALESVFTSAPGLKVVAPATASDAYHLLRAAIQDPDPVLFLEPLREYRGHRQTIEDASVGIGAARLARSGRDVTLLAWSGQVRVCEEVAKILEAEGIDCEVIDLRTLNPLDEDTIILSVRKTGRAVIVQEAAITGGFGSEVSALIAEHCVPDLKASVCRIGGPDAAYPLAMVEKHYLPSVGNIVDQARRLVRSK